MTYREDKFRVGDLVVWANNMYANAAPQSKSLGEGPFVVTGIDDVAKEKWNDFGTMSNWDAMGHTQFVNIDGNPLSFSGIYFVKYESSEVLEDSEQWTASAFHSWLTEELFNFRKSEEGMLYESADRIKTPKEWVERFYEFIKDSV